MPGNGSTTVNFGTFPGSPEASTDVTGQSGFVAASIVEAWLLPIATADHSIDEHVAEKEAMDVIAQYKVDGTLTIRASARIFQQLREVNNEFSQASSRGPGVDYTPEPRLLHGLFTMGWAWT